MPHIRRVAYLLVLLVGTALTTAKVWHPAPPRAFAGIRSADVPRLVDGYAAPQDSPVDPIVQKALESADIVSRTYARGTSDLPVDVILIGGTDRNALHDPRSCLVGAGWQLADDHTERLPGTKIEARACHAVGQPGAANYDILYLYVVDGQVINQVTQIRAAMLWSALLGRQNAPVYFLRFQQPLGAERAANAAQHTQMTEFAARLWTQLQPRLQPPHG